MSLPEPKTCEPCGRDFIPSRCSDHCGPACCRLRRCANAKPIARKPGAKTRTCVVCGRSNARFPFERFAACDEGCNRVRFNGRQGVDHAGIMRVWYCQGVLADSAGRDLLHHPAHHVPRIHRLYCSLRCWASPTYGHEARTRTGAGRRHATYWCKTGSKHTFLREMRRIRNRKGSSYIV